MSLRLAVLEGRYAVCRLSPGVQVPTPSAGTRLYSLTLTPDETSLLCAEEEAPAGATVEGGWRCLVVAGPLPFSMTGVLAGITAALAAHEIPVFAVSSYDTDYILVQEGMLAAAVGALRSAGYTVAAGEDHVSRGTHPGRGR